MLTFVTKDIPQSLWSFISRQLTTSLEVTSREEEFIALTQWVERKGFTKRFRTLRTRNKELSAGFGRHYFLNGRRLFWFTRGRVERKEQDIEEITLSCFGRNQSVLRNLIREAVGDIHRSDQTRIYTPRWHDWQLLTQQPKRPLESIFMTSRARADLKKHLNFFFRSRD